LRDLWQFINKIGGRETKFLATCVACCDVRPTDAQQYSPINENTRTLAIFHIVSDID